MPDNAAWQLEDFVDSLVVDLDKTRETLAVKAINKPLSYTVKEVALDLNIFPTFDGDRVSFVTAQPGQQGSSKVTIQLGSITDQQVRATTKAPTTSKGNVQIEDMPVDKATKSKLRRIGVSSSDDLKQIQQRHVDLKQVTDNDVDYSGLANQIDKARRNDTPPRVSGVSLSMDDGRPCLVVKGEHLSIDPSFPPVAAIDQRLAEVTSADPREVRVQLPPGHRLRPDNQLILTFDPFAVVRLNVRG
ncbi:MAG: hypothetical protein ACYDHH_00190 [Solirubrobacteraceae bacterium]